MKTIKRTKVLGYIFKPPEGAYITVDAWLREKAPSNSKVYDTPTSLKAVGIPIVDAVKIDGVYNKASIKPKTEEVLVMIPHSGYKLCDLAKLKKAFFPGFIFYDKDKLKHKARNIGTSQPSKISKS